MILWKKLNDIKCIYFTLGYCIFKFFLGDDLYFVIYTDECIFIHGSCEPYHFKKHSFTSGCCGSPWLISILFLHWLFLIAIMLLCLLRFWFLTIALIYISLYCWTINGLECEAMHICVWIHSDQLFVVMYSYQCSSELLFIICGIDFPRYFLHIFDKIYPS